MNVAPQAISAPDLTTCDREPIHIPGSIQPNGVLLALKPDTLELVQAGGRTIDYLGYTTDELLGHPIELWLSLSQIAKLREFARRKESLIRPVHAFTIQSADATEDAEAVIHSRNGFLILEFIPNREPCPKFTLELVQAMVQKIQNAETLSEFCQLVTEAVREETKFDRVMVYRFLEDGSGAVEAESKATALEPYLGLHYPASDIPKQARELYLINWIRLIADVNYEPAPLHPPFAAGLGLPLDLTHSALRSVSPLHLEYLRNMGVKATLTLSLIVKGELWGLIACHSQTPRFLPHGLRRALEIFSQMVSFLLQSLLTLHELNAGALAKKCYDHILTQLAGDTDLIDNIWQLRHQLLAMIEADGLALFIEGKLSTAGTVPEEAEVFSIVNWLNETNTNGVFHTHCLPLIYPPAIHFASVASGILVLTVSKNPRDYIIWFRAEMIETVHWGGNPDKSVNIEPETLRISPRKSFSVWQQEVRYHCKPWESLALHTAQTFRTTLIEIILTRIDQLARERENARKDQKILLAALHDKLMKWRASNRLLKQETNLRSAAQAELAEVLQKTVQDQEAIRQQISRELHDTLGQYLAVMGLSLNNFADTSLDPPEFKSRICELKDLTDAISQEVERLAWELRPTALDDLGLAAALQQFLDEWSERSQIGFEIHTTLADQRWPSSVEATLYRIVQEAVTNIIKHSEATKVCIILSVEKRTALLIVEDNGKGFNLNSSGTETKPPLRLGLHGMRERLQHFGGTLEIETAPRKGTTLIARIPLQ